jgi:hypothetical protein
MARAPRRPTDAPRIGKWRIKRRYLIVAVLLLSINLLAIFFRDSWDAGWLGRFILPLLGQVLLLALGVALVAALVAGIRILLARNDG